MYITATIVYHKSVRLSGKERITIGQEDSNAIMDKRTYSVAEIQSILEISRRKAYELCNSNSFKVVRIGKTIRISKLAFDKWLDENYL